MCTKEILCMARARAHVRILVKSICICKLMWDIWSLCVFPCWRLRDVAVVGSSSSLPSSSASFSAGATWGTLKSMNIDQIHKIHAPQFQRRVLFGNFGGNKRLRQDLTMGLGGTLKSMKQHPQHTCATIPRGVFLGERKSACGRIIDHGMVDWLVGKIQSTCT